MKEKKNISIKMAAVLLAVCLLIGGTVGGTLAWLTATSETVINTFAVGDIKISLAETTNADSYKIVPGGESAKDPVLTVSSGSEKCYVYVLVENNVVLDGTPVATPNINATNWTTVKYEGTKTLYRYSSVVDASNEDQKLPVFTTVEYADSITKTDMPTLKEKSIVVSGYAHQSENIDDDTIADNAAIAWAFPAASN